MHIAYGIRLIAAALLPLPSSASGGGSRGDHADQPDLVSLLGLRQAKLDLPRHPPETAGEFRPDVDDHRNRGRRRRHLSSEMTRASRSLSGRSPAPAPAHVSAPKWG